MLDKTIELLTTLPRAPMLIILFYFLAWLVHTQAGRLAERMVRLSRFNFYHRISPERLHTLRQLIASAISFIAFATATLVSLAQFIALDTLVWMVGLFSAAFGLGASPLIRDFLTGISFIFEDTFHVGEKVEVLGVEGVVEAVNLRTTLLRAPTGELYVMPNGEVRMVRNFSRGLYSTADIKIKIATADLDEALPLLDKMGQEAVDLLPNLLEPWQVIIDSSAVGQRVELTVLAKARFSHAAEIRPHLLTLVQQRLAEFDITLVD